MRFKLVVPHCNGGGRCRQAREASRVVYRDVVSTAHRSAREARGRAWCHGAMGAGASTGSAGAGSASGTTNGGESSWTSKGHAARAKLRTGLAMSITRMGEVEQDMRKVSPEELDKVRLQVLRSNESLAASALRSALAPPNYQ